MECLVICHDPATTESYTYRHTLSLHDALPIWFTRLRVSREFGNPEEAAAIFDEIAGEEGPFQDFAVTHEDSFASTEWGFTGRVDFSGGLEAQIGRASCRERVCQYV